MQYHADGNRMRSLAPTASCPASAQLAAAYTVNELGNWIGEIALAVLVYDQTGSPLATAALFLGMQFAPSLPRAGRGRTGRGGRHEADAAAPVPRRGGHFVALAATADNFALWLVVALAAVDGTLAIGARALTRASAAAVLTPPGCCARATRSSTSASPAPAPSGPALAGVAVAALGIETALLLDAASFVLVAAMLAAADVAAPGEGAARALACAGCGRGSPT